MIPLKQSIFQLLQAITTNVYDSRTPSPTSYPYVNTRYPTTLENDESFRVIHTLEIDVWDNIPNTARIEQLADDIDAEINRYMNTEQFYRIYRMSPFRLELDEPDRNIRRRQLRYQILQFKREE
jgi:hypothetical protein